MTNRALVYLVGYEARSAYVASSENFDIEIAVLPEACRELNYSKNYETAQKRNAEFVEENDLENYFQDFFSNDGHAKISELVVDISSMRRSLIANLIDIIISYSQKIGFLASLRYALGEYQLPSAESPSYLHIEPINDLEGWTEYPERPLSLIVGLGYEQDLAVAALEYLDPSGVWAYLADGKDARYKADVKQANATLLNVITEDRLLEYDICTPVEVFRDVLEMTQTLASRSRVVIVAGGPKIFSAMAILVKRLVGDEVAVWKVSSHGHIPLRDVKAEGTVVSLPLFLHF